MSFNRVPAARMWMLNSHWELNNNCLHIYLEKNGIEFLKNEDVTLYGKLLQKSRFSFKNF